MKACLLILPLLFAAPAFAQTDAGAPYSAATADCLAKNKDKANPPADDIAACQAALIAVDAVFAGTPAPTPHQVNMRHLYRAFAQTTIGSGYGSIDQARSSRVCTAIETGWSDLSLIVDANSPADYVETFTVVRKAAIPALTKCRAEKGTPPGAAPLP